MIFLLATDAMLQIICATYEADKVENGQKKHASGGTNAKGARSSTNDNTANDK